MNERSPIPPAARRASASRSAAFSLAVVALFWSGVVQALPPLQTVSPFDVTGVLQAATVTAPTDPLSGGTLTVNNQVITIPRNLLVQFPATFMTWPEMFRLAPAPYGPTQTGLALTDSPPPIGAYEVHVQGNRVGDQHIAALVTISQRLLQMGQGYVNYIDYARGELHVGGKLNDPSSGQRVRLNDPIGRFGPVWTPDVRFTVDETNATVRSETGYPMCIPRVDPAGGQDPECPQYNRPVDPSTGGYVTIFTMPDPALGATPDPRKQAPFEIGDYVTYSGILVKDGSEPTAGPAATTGTLVAAYSVFANLAIFTWPGADPAYIAIDVAILGVGGTPIAGVPQEATVRTRFEGFSTDPSRIVVLFGVDQDPCTGVVSERDWGMVAIDPGPPVGAVLGRWRFRPPSKVLAMPSAGVFLPATRTVRAAMPATPMVVANGLVSGTYEAPIAEYLFPENLAVGGPQVPFNFQEFPFLSNGSGPWNGIGSNPIFAGIVGQLSPWPGQPVPTAPTCAPISGGSGSTSGSTSGGTTTGGTTTTTTPLAPIANAGLPLTVASGAPVQLNALGTTDPNSPPLALTYEWTQISGPGVKLNGPSTATPTFTAPAVAPGNPVVLSFWLNVKNSAGLGSTAQVNVTVNPVVAPIANAGKNQVALTNSIVTLSGSASTDPNGLPLTYRWTQSGGPLVSISQSRTSSAASFRAPSFGVVTLTFTLTVSNGFLSSTALVTVTVYAQPDTIAITAATYSTAQQRLVVTATSSVGAQLYLKGINGGPNVPLTDPVGEALLLGSTVTLTGVPNPFNVTVISNLGGTATTNVTVVR